MTQATSVISYLKKHPDFLDKHPQLLKDLDIPHPRGVGTLSLLERQVSVLRQQLNEAVSQLNEIMAVAEFNYNEQKKLYAFVLTLVTCKDNEAIGQLFERKFNTQFALGETKMLLWKGKPSIKKKHKELLRYVDESGIFCGHIPAEHMAVITTKTSRSVALLTLGKNANKGLIVFIAEDGRFLQPELSTLLLEFIGKLTDTLLR